ncbi:MAG: polyhydroxyalkanoate synthesis regulator DNA-binding domain-containing protein [Candidatus Methylomirabilales bacterium]
MTEQPLLIKKYSNRKLYDTSRSRYITLEEIADLIREGKLVKIVDTTSREDLTTVTLAQIILEEEKRTNFLPVSFLHQLIQYGESFRELFQRQLSSNLEAFMATQSEAGKLWKEWAMRGWTPPGRKLDQGQPASREQPEEPAHASLKTELESLKESLERLERKLKETEKRSVETP